MYLKTLGLKRSGVHFWLANFYVYNIPEKRISTHLSQELDSDENEEDNNILNNEPIPTKTCHCKNSQTNGFHF